MALFNHETWVVHDDYMTKKQTWEDIKDHIPKDKVIWEAFWGDGKSGTYLKELGFKTIHEEIDFYTHDKGEIVISNPPFSQAREVLERLKKLNKPFILILPSSKINTQYFRRTFLNCEDRIQIIIPKKRIQFDRYKDGKRNDKTMNASFDCFYYCWKMNLEHDITFVK